MSKIECVPVVTPKSDNWIVETLKGLLEDAIHRRITVLDISATIDGENVKVRLESTSK